MRLPACVYFYYGVVMMLHEHVDDDITIGPRALRSQNNIEKIRHSMMVATFDGNPRATIVSCYSPTNLSEEPDLITFYNELSSLVRSIPKHNVFIIGGDMNAQIGKTETANSVYTTRQAEKGEHLTDFTLENRLTYLNTKFQKREVKL